MMNVAVIEYRWEGHHPVYFREYVKTLALGLGCRVYAFCPKPEDELLKQLSEGAFADRVYLIRWQPPQLTVRPRRFNFQISWWLAFDWLIRTLRTIERRDLLKFDFLFFACLYDSDLRCFPRHIPWKWGGLYIYVRAFRMPDTVLPYSNLMPDPQRWFRRPNLAGIALLDENAVEFMRQETGCANIVSFPDFADDSPPLFNDVSAELIDFAAGKPIVGIAGHLQPTKGVCVFAKVAEQMMNQKIAFAFVGKLMTGLFSNDDKELLRRVMALPNVFSYLDRLPDEAAFNAVISCFDVFFAAYVNFPNSSNTLAKAALFRKPVIVSDGYLMAERVRKYRLGSVVPEGDVQAVVLSVQSLLSAPNMEDSAGCSAYLAHHSKSVLIDQFKTLMRGVLESK
jgi:glycosyltransferase involved in cell wall biosynthesis